MPAKLVDPPESALSESGSGPSIQLKQNWAFYPQQKHSREVMQMMAISSGLTKQIDSNSTSPEFSCPAEF